MHLTALGVIGERLGRGVVVVGERVPRVLGLGLVRAARVLALAGAEPRGDDLAEELGEPHLDERAVGGEAGCDDGAAGFDLGPDGVVDGGVCWLKMF